MIKLARRIANRSKDYVLFNPLLESFWVDKMRGRVAAMLYHQVQAGPESEFLVRGGSPSISVNGLRADLAFFKKQGARFFTFADLITGRFPEKNEIGIAVCFDDCFANNYREGLFVLNEQGVTATFFQTTALVDATDLLWEHKLYWYTRNETVSKQFAALAANCLAAPKYLTYPTAELLHVLRERIPFIECERVLSAADETLSSPDERVREARQIYPSAAMVRSAASCGHEIASHGHQHLFRACVTAAEFATDLVRSAQILTEIAGCRSTTYSFPFDSWAAEDEAAVLRVFDAACTVSKKPILKVDDKRLLPRFTWPGAAPNSLRHRRWLVTGTI